MRESRVSKGRVHTGGANSAEAHVVERKFRVGLARDGDRVVAGRVAVILGGDGHEVVVARCDVQVAGIEVNQVREAPLNLPHALVHRLALDAVQLRTQSYSQHQGNHILRGLLLQY